MNVKALIIRFGIGTLVAASAAVSAMEPVVDLAVVEPVEATSDSVSADIAARHEQFLPVGPETSLSESARVRSELQLADDMARQLDDQLERRLASQLQRLI